MIWTKLHRHVIWGAILLGGILAAGLIWWLRPAAEQVFVVDATWSHLMRAAREGDASRVRDLLASGCDPNVRGGSQGLTPLIVSAANGQHDVVELLLSHGASVELADTSGMTPLMNAVLFDQPEVVQLLLDHGANVNAASSTSSMTSLMFAATPTMARLLLQNGANASLRSNAGKTAADHAQDVGRSELAAMMRMLERPSVNPNATDIPHTTISGVTPPVTNDPIVGEQP
jgi:ankyrin repeat protein